MGEAKRRASVAVRDAVEALAVEYRCVGTPIEQRTLYC